MDLAKKQQISPFFDLRLVTLLLNLPGIWLTLYIIYLAAHDPGLSSGLLGDREFLLSEYKYYRNIYYLLYAGILTLSGFSIMFRGIKGLSERVNFPKDNTGNTNYLIPAAVQGIIFVTFSFAFAGIILDLYFLVMRII